MSSAMLGLSTLHRRAGYSKRCLQVCSCFFRTVLISVFFVAYYIYPHPQAPGWRHHRLIPRLFPPPQAPFSRPDRDPQYPHSSKEVSPVPNRLRTSSTSQNPYPAPSQHAPPSRTATSIGGENENRRGWEVLVRARCADTCGQNRGESLG